MLSYENSLLNFLEVDAYINENHSIIIAIEYIFFLDYKPTEDRNPVSFSAVILSPGGA